MGNCNCLSLQPDDNPAPASETNNLSGRSIRLSAGLSNLRLIQNGNSTSLGRSSNSGRNSRLFSSSNNHSTGNNTSTSFWGSENSQASRVRDDEEFPYGQILDAANLKVFTLAELKEATKNFRLDSVLGEGGFGRVFKGLIKKSSGSKRGEGLTIAIKKLNSESRQGVAEWQSEVNFLGRLSHPNLVKLLGFGREDGELFLVYEFMHRGSLDNHLFGRGSNVRPLSWDRRLKVMIGAARGLNFLHSLEKKIIYRDFKPSNILLDKAYTSKLSDFGLARSVPSDDHTHVSTQVVGTCGYAAPEYIRTGLIIEIKCSNCNQDFQNSNKKSYSIHEFTIIVVISVYTAVIRTTHLESRGAVVQCCCQPVMIWCVVWSFSPWRVVPRFQICSPIFTVAILLHVEFL
ncbi:probable serine/threonine-protein kinase PIX13 isoform X2 [Cicer arietinum]|uniref:non-specific serine/threonine protein kinase n=1 Tax=Cicer arietinum TaxID=3827 RepID=A0A1S2YPH4_CICAR|nr:probable serine/threonine-protein kinase PIX13 isoform X2 [Cicer arietinum]